MSDYYTQDSRLVGAATIISDGTRLVASCVDTRRLVAMSTALVISGDSGVLDAEPGALVSAASKTWTPMSDGTVRSFTQAATPAASTSTRVNATTTGWITANSSIIIAPGEAHSMVSLNSAGTVLYHADGLQVQWAIYTGGYLYAFNGFGAGVVYTVDGTTGAFAEVSTFLAPNAKDIRDGAVDGTNLILATKTRKIIVSLTSAAAPVETSQVSLSNLVRLTGISVLSSGVHFLSAFDPIASENHPFGYGQAKGLVVGGGLYLTHPRTGRVSFVSDVTTLSGV